ncbi:anhydro-N-acetylmuramic acid kinase, partial [Solemya elarraichensis gill symbiont]
MQRGGDLVEKLRPEDVQATLLELTAATITQAINKQAPGTERALVCGGGVHNGTLMQRMQALLPGIRVGT